MDATQEALDDMAREWYNDQMFQLLEREQETAE